MADDETRYIVITMAIPMECRCVCGEMHRVSPQDLESAFLGLAHRICDVCGDSPLFQISVMQEMISTGDGYKH